MAANFQDQVTSQIKETRKAAASGWIGSLLEYYDFFIYAMAAAFVFPELFFPADNQMVAITASLATYGVGYVARPLGAVMLGHWGDRHGRKSVLLVCMFLMGGATIGVGLLPTYEQIGITAPIILVILRLLQGFAVAGEMSGAGSLILEQAPMGKRGFYASFSQQGSSIGQLLAAAVFIPLTIFLPDEAFMTWGWRVPFLMSFIVIIAGFMIRRHVRETRVFTAASRHSKPAHAPAIEAFRTSWRDMLRVMFMSLNNVVPVVITVFGGAYAMQVAYGIAMPREVFLWIPILSHATAVVVMPVMGLLSDHIGRRPVAITGIIGAGVMCYFFLDAISQHNTMLAMVYAVVGWGVIYQGFNAVYPAYYPELFRADVRVSAVAISNNIGVPAASLLAMVFVMVAPPGAEHIPLTIGGLAFFVTLLSAAAVFTGRETYRMPMQDLDTPLPQAGTLSASQGADNGKVDDGKVDDGEYAERQNPCALSPHIAPCCASGAASSTSGKASVKL